MAQSPQALKARQDEYDARTKRLRCHFVPFSISIMEELCKWVADAKKAGLRGVEFRPRQKPDGGDIIQEFSLNGIALTIAMSSDVLPLANAVDALAAQLFVFFTNNPSAPATMKVTFCEKPEKAFHYTAERWRGEKYWPTLTGTMLVDSPVSGGDVACHIVTFAYEWTLVCEPKLSLNDFRETTGVARKAIGFRAGLDG